jgi:hypothetical protein
MFWKKIILQSEKELIDKFMMPPPEKIPKLKLRKKAHKWEIVTMTGHNITISSGRPIAGGEDKRYLSLRRLQNSLTETVKPLPPVPSEERLRFGRLIQQQPPMQEARPQLQPQTIQPWMFPNTVWTHGAPLAQHPTTTDASKTATVETHQRLYPRLPSLQELNDQEPLPPLPNIKVDRRKQSRPIKIPSLRPVSAYNIPTERRTPLEDTLVTKPT